MSRGGRRHISDALRWVLSSFNEYVWIAIKISLKFVPLGPIDNNMNKPSLVHIMNGLALIKQQAIISTNDDLVYWQIFASLGLSDLIHWGQDKMAAISHMTFSNSLSWMKIFVHLFWFKLHWRLILRIQLTISHQFSLLQIMAWRRAGDKPLLKQWLFTLLLHIWVTHQPEKS